MSPKPDPLVPRRALLHWPAPRTLDWLQQRYPELFHQCEMIFGRQRAGQIVYGTHSRKWP